MPLIVKTIRAHDGPYNDVTISCSQSSSCLLRVALSLIGKEHGECPYRIDRHVFTLHKGSQHLRYVFIDALEVFKCLASIEEYTPTNVNYNPVNVSDEAHKPGYRNICLRAQHL